MGVLLAHCSDCQGRAGKGSCQVNPCQYPLQTLELQSLRPCGALQAVQPPTHQAHPLPPTPPLFHTLPPFPTLFLTCALMVAPPGDGTQFLQSNLHALLDGRCVTSRWSRCHASPHPAVCSSSHTRQLTSSAKGNRLAASRCATHLRWNMEGSWAKVGCHSCAQQGFYKGFVWVGVTEWVLTRVGEGGTRVRWNMEGSCAKVGCHGCAQQGFHKGGVGALHQSSLWPKTNVPTSVFKQTTPHFCD